jgi:GTP pyrophosphokinase
MVEKEFRKYKLSLKVLHDEQLVKEVLAKFGYAALEDLYAGVGFGKVTAHAFVSSLVPEDQLSPAPPDGAVKRAVKRVLGLHDRGVRVRGLDDVMVTLAKCCNPVRGEDIVGYITRGRGVSVHSTQCPNLGKLMFDSDRRIPVSWDDGREEHETFDVKLVMDVTDRQGLLAKIISTIADLKANIKNVDARTYEGQDASIGLVIAVRDRQHMQGVVSQLRRIEGVIDVRRVRS